ncbi:protein serine/threonine kinase, putative [Entamoeba invadens IP1]|uniref:Protein serine/threonine kinase, putative n=1 Tax=Entamoeba invadens IP1 TaxID=370355 RepID=A0A0A1U0D8_ENTIV|nr:protein serine/threonine kinase, putative [Entamoeba invadens IP1]ELP84353.1 protein serine/threonine kinase, putative [Entamoeba invadens IP1]|eukprot:XP_004183699.1 protein serine/threonine kinase, putative [Entamoeba invadens IP1]
MTNMTFTKTIGTPVYMSPEVLSQENYQQPADIYSFAITMYETVTWEKSYPQKEFPFPWVIAQFVTSGKRLPHVSKIPQTYFEVIQMGWEQDKHTRIQIEKLVSLMEHL